MPHLTCRVLTSRRRTLVLNLKHASQLLLLLLVLVLVLLQLLLMRCLLLSHLLHDLRFRLNLK